MNNTETVKLLIRIRAAKPSQTFDEFTADVWAEDLVGVRYEDALQAARELNLELAYIGTADIVARVKHIRSERVKAAPPYVPSSNDLTPAQQAAEQREHYRRAGDGETLPAVDYAALPARPALSLLGRKVERA